jgi:hypothetical protein
MSEKNNFCRLGVKIQVFFSENQKIKFLNSIQLSVSLASESDEEKMGNNNLYDNDNLILSLKEIEKKSEIRKSDKFSAANHDNKFVFLQYLCIERYLQLLIDGENKMNVCSKYRFQIQID